MIMMLNFSVLCIKTKALKFRFAVFYCFFIKINPAIIWVYRNLNANCQYTNLTSFVLMTMILLHCFRQNRPKKTFKLK